MKRPVTAVVLAHLAAAGVACRSAEVPAVDVAPKDTAAVLPSAPPLATASASAPSASAPLASATPSTSATPSATAMPLATTAPSATAPKARGLAVGEPCRVGANECAYPLECAAGFDGAHTIPGPGTCVRPGPRPGGRPLLVDGAAHVAKPVPGRAWHAGGLPEAADGADLEPFRDALSRAALDEHASVAAFARTICQLVALGAPAALVAKTQRALADEIVHAEQSFAWLARLGGGASSPGPLPEAVAPFPGASDREALAAALLRDVFRGGCVGETLAAHEAADHAARATGELRAFYERIADDEARHAALAYETALWVVGELPALGAVLREERARWDAEAPAADRALLAPLLEVLHRA